MKGVRADLQRLTSAIQNGVDATLFAAQMNELGRRRTALDHEVAASTETETPALLHPRLAQIYAKNVEPLATAFESPASQAEAQEIIHSLIDRVMRIPVDGIYSRAERRPGRHPAHRQKSQTQKGPGSDCSRGYAGRTTNEGGCGDRI